MGTGALALALSGQAATWGWAWANTVGQVTLALASALALLLLPRYARRLADGGGLRAELADPGHGAMLATLPAGLLVLAVGWGRIGPTFVPEPVAVWTVGVLLIAGVVLALAIGLGWSASMLRGKQGLEAVNGGWLIPPVMNLLVPLALAPLMVAIPAAAPLLVLIGFAFYGAGAILFLAILTLLVARLALRDPMPAGMAASLWIPLAPAGVLGLSMLRLLQAAAEAGVSGLPSPSAAIPVVAMGIGFGLWWAAFAGLELRRIRRAGGVPVHPGWWGFVFPVAAMALSITAVGAATGVWLVEATGLLATATLVVLWCYVAVRTIRMLGRASRP